MVGSGRLHVPLLVLNEIVHHLSGITGVSDLHVHIYFDPAELGQARSLARAAQKRFNLSVGRFHQRPVGPHPRGSCQLTVAVSEFGPFATWAAVHRGTLTIFAHASTGNDLADHTQHVIWFGPSERPHLSIFT
jgi:DOPA 4,5-dioxygenase